MRDIYLLNHEPFEGVINLPMIKINFLQEEIDLDDYDSVIFTSKNAVKAIQRINQSWIHKEIYSIGTGTSREIEKHHAHPILTAKSSYGNAFAEEIKDQLKNKRVLFLRAKKVLSDLSTILKTHHVDLDEKVVYETVCQSHNKEQQPPRDSIIIFTSPSTYQCFIKNFTWDASYKAIAIGSVTASALPSHIDIHLAKEQTIQSCVDLAKTI
ncbi:uroporphyrinogen-III synthase [Sulfurospirillum sp. 1612]|uniref:uroporphyrinogen-III synthase n=1 Tax=Sulfurospirillum sp. 1612 TaxID=3094835 RepID=UPI002F93CA9A